MAQRVYQFNATIPAGTTEDNPATIDLDIDNWELESIDLEVPAGPSGLMGFAIYNNGMQWIPATPGAWLKWDDVQQSWMMSDQPNASGWQVVGYNDGYYDHSVTVRMHVNQPSDAGTATTTPAVTFITTPATDPNVVTL